MKTRRYIAYFRVSTQRQGRSGLGLEAQQQAVGVFLQGHKKLIIESFTEIESGRKNDRPQLAAALDACRKHKAVLVIAKLDRLARNVHFISGLMKRCRIRGCGHAGGQPADHPHTGGSRRA